MDKTFKQFLSEKISRKGALELKDMIRNYQARQHRDGNKITWDEAKSHIESGIKAAKKEAKKLENAGKKKAKSSKPREKFMTASQFNKLMQSVASDFSSDNPDTSLENVVWDLATAMLYDPEVEKYVRKTMAKNSGMKPEAIDKNRMIDFIADSIYG